MVNELDKRVSRILGQLRGIQKMVAENRKEVDILQQVSAVKKAIDGLSTEVVLQYFKKNPNGQTIEEIKELIKRMVDL